MTVLLERVGAVGGDDFAPFVEERVEPRFVVAFGGVVDDVEVRCRGVVGKVDELAAAVDEARSVEEVDERDGGDDSGTAVGTRGNGCPFEAAGEREQCVRLGRVEHDFGTLFVDERQPRGHVLTVPSAGMRAVTVVQGHLQVLDHPDPSPEGDQVLIRVHGAGLNRADLLQRAGRYPAPPGAPADIPGLEFAGVVEGVGAEASGVRIGDPVFGITGGGAQAEYLLVPAGHCAPVPPGLDLVAMGGVPEACITAHDAMVTQAGGGAGDWVLIHAVGSGVGTAGLQLAKALGASVVGTARTAEKLDRCVALGLDHGIVPALRSDGTLDVDALAFAVIEATGAGADVTLDLVGGAYVEASIGAAAVLGRIVLIGALGGGSANLSVMGVMGKRLRIFGTVLRARDKAEKAAATDAFARDVVPLLASGAVAPVVDAVFPLSDAEAAYDLLASDTTFGKVILDCRG